MARVLVVDDEPANVELLQDFLEAKGYQVSTALSGFEALQRLREDRPHLILLDIRMPGMDGMEVLRRIREIDRDVGVIIVTAVHEEEIGRRALAQGAFDYITKPLDLQYLENCVWFKIAETRL
jgi:CheY-like chemotaxis protein